MESVASINEPSRATRSPSSGYLLGSMLDALRLSFSNTIWSCSSPRSLIASEKLLFLMPPSGAMFHERSHPVQGLAAYDEPRHVLRDERNQYFELIFEGHFERPVSTGLK